MRAQVRRLRIVYESGTAKVQMTGMVYAPGRRGLGLGVATGTEQTILSKAAEPPMERKVSKRPVLTGLGIAAGGFVLSKIMQWDALFLIALAAAAIVGAFLAVEENQDNQEWNDSELPALRAKWDRSAICLRCGAEFELERQERSRV